MKAHAISGRDLKKVFFDLWTLVRIHKWTLKDIIAMLKKKYEAYNTLMFIKALTYFEDAEKNQDSKVVEREWSEIKRFFKDYVKDYIDSLGK